MDFRADKDFDKLPKNVQFEFLGLFKALEETGRLEIPYAKKMSGFKNLYEMRLRLNGQWRVFYAYFDKDLIIVLHIMMKKSQKTPQNDLDTAVNRLKSYL
ncbi:MAG: type II toxin-antitoxin system RelE/ParE family toxin [bacterium]